MRCAVEQQQATAHQRAPQEPQARHVQSPARPSFTREARWEVQCALYLGEPETQSCLSGSRRFVGRAVALIARAPLRGCKRGHRIVCFGSNRFGMPYGRQRFARRSRLHAGNRPSPPSLCRSRNQCTGRLRSYTSRHCNRGIGSYCSDQSSLRSSQWRIAWIQAPNPGQSAGRK